MIDPQKKENDMTAGWLRSQRTANCGAAGLAQALVLTLVLSLGLPACVEDNAAFFIRQNQVPGAGCVIGTETDVYRARGTLDVSVGLGYVLFPLLENTAPQSSAVDSLPERSTLYLKRFDVQLDMGSIPATFAVEELQFSELTSGTVLPGAVVSSSVRVVKDALAKRLSGVVPAGVRATIVATVRAVATRTGTEIESSEFLYPIELCNGCLVDLRAKCPDSTDTTAITNPCGLPQDTPVTCCHDSSRGMVCLASTSST